MTKKKSPRNPSLTPSLSRSIGQQARTKNESIPLSVLPKPGDLVDWCRDHPSVHCEPAIVIKNAMSPGGMQGHLHIHPLGSMQFTIFPVQASTCCLRRWREITEDECP